MPDRAHVFFRPRHAIKAKKNPLQGHSKTPLLLARIVIVLCCVSTTQHGEEAEICSAASTLLLLTVIRFCGVCPRVHHHQPVQDGDLACGDPRRELRRRRVLAPAGAVDGVHGAGGVVGPHLGPHRLQLRRVRERLLLHGLLRVVAPVRRLRRAPREPGRVHTRRGGLLRREPGGRVQPADGDQAGERAGQLQRGGVRRRPPADVPVGAGGEGQRADGGVPERLRRVQHGPVLLPGAVREPGDVPANLLLQEVQGGVPHRLQLRLRRPHQHLHLLKRRLHHHLLLQQEAIRMLVPQQPPRLQQRLLPLEQILHIVHTPHARAALHHQRLICNLTCRYDDHIILIAS